jgi:hypothetical protein
MKKDEVVLETVGDLVIHLSKFNPNASIIIDIQGNTTDMKRRSVAIWNENDPESPVAIYVGEFIDEVDEILGDVGELIRKPTTVN